MAQKKAVTNEIRKRYRAATKKQKMMILDEFCALTGYNRVYGARMLRQRTELRVVGKKRKGSLKYDEETLRPLRKIWAAMDGVCGKRVAPFIPEMIEVLTRHGELELTPEQKEKLLVVSAATIDRRLAPERKKLELKGRGGTKPGSLLKSQIPVRTFSEWNEERPGFVEIDLVGHEGGNSKGDFCQTLDMVDVFSGWTETRVVKNKAQKWVFAAIKDARRTLPFPLLGIDSDNGSEFINDQLLRYCKDERITFTRSRPHNKNDGCHVEQKNWSIVRRAIGYHRYDTDDELKTISELYRRLRLYTNFFQPSQKLVEKIRIGAKIKKRHDSAKTPYQRIMTCEHVSDNDKAALERQYMKLNPVALKKEIISLQKKLYKLVSLKDQLRRKEATVTEALEYTLPEATTQPFGYIFG